MSTEYQQQPAPRVDVRDAPEASRYEARLVGATASADPESVAVATYTRRGDTITFWHTYVPPSMEGHGVGGALARTALEAARRDGLTVVPRCPFVASYIRRHPEYLDLVRESLRAELVDRV